MSKLNFEMTTLDAMVALSEGHAGAATALLAVQRYANEIDKASALGVFGVFANLDESRLYGQNLWVFYKETCKGSVWVLIMLLRAVQLGLLSAKTMRAMPEDELRNYGKKVVEELNGEFLSKEEFDAL